MTIDSNSVRKKLIEITTQGLMLKAITRNTGIDSADLSRYKKGMDCLNDSDVELLSDYLKGVVIPQWSSGIKCQYDKSGKKKSTRDMLFL